MEVAVISHKAGGRKTNGEKGVSAVIPRSTDSSGSSRLRDASAWRRAYNKLMRASFEFFCQALSERTFLRLYHLTIKKAIMQDISPMNIPQACKKGWTKGRSFPSVLSDFIVSAHLK